MEEFRPPTSQTESNNDQAENKLPIQFKVEEYLFAILIILSIIGIAVTNYANVYALKYWLFMVPVFAGVSLYYGWIREHDYDKQNIPKIIKDQVLLWIGLLAAVLMVLLLVNYGSLNARDAGYFIIILLSLTTYIVGIHYEWRLIVLAVLLGLTAGVAALVEHFFWMMLVLAIVAGALVVYKKRKNY